MSVDAVRGAIMIIMALDHIRDFVHRGAMSFSPTDLSRTTVVLFFTRWITHFCAPGFMFTAGIGAYLWRQRGRTKKQLSTFLLTRGIWLIILELTVMHFAYDFDLSLHYPLLLLVLWGLGICMVGLAALIWLPEMLLLSLSIATIVFHEFLDGVSASQFGSLSWLWNLLHVVGPFQVAGTTMITGYPLIPWIAVMALGYCAGKIFSTESEQRKKFLITAGTAVTAAFVLVRAINAYGDPVRWSTQGTGMFTILSFLNTTKYPPSLAFILMTLGPLLIALACFEKTTLSPRNPLIVFGRVPLFYFVLHFFAAHVVAVALGWLRYGSSAFAFIFHRVPSMGGPASLFPSGFGYDLWVAYAVWIGVVAGLYPLCRWFAGIKARRRDWWLSYL